jgi:integrase
MASIQKRPDGRWRARYRDPAGKEHARHFVRKVDGQRWLDEVTAAVVTGAYVHPKAGQVTFRDYAEQWRASQVHRPTTRAHVETMLRRHAYPTFGSKPLSSILPSDVQAWVRKLEPVLAPATIGVAHSLVSSVMKAAVRDRRIVANPCEGIRLPKTQRAPVVPPSTEQVLTLTEAMPERLRALVTLAAGSGLRQGEAFGLTVDRVDFLRRTVLVDRQLVTLPRQAPFLASPKTSASVRTVPLPRVVVDVLAAHLAAQPGTEYVFTLAGGPIRRTAFGHIWRPASRQAGLPTVTGFHFLRHYYASLLIRHGESVKTVQARLGHASAVETLDTYSHLWPDSDDRTREAIDSVLGPAADSLRTAEAR